MKQFKAPKSAPLAFHEHHKVVIKPSDKLPGQAYYYCVGCRKWVAWLSKKDTQTAKELGLF